jgi:hypothetical protein
MQQSQQFDDSFMGEECSTPSSVDPGIKASISKFLTPLAFHHPYLDDVIHRSLFPLPISTDVFLSCEGVGLIRERA